MAARVRCLPGGSTSTITPTSSSHAGRYKVRVRGRDSGRLWDEVDFVLEVAEVNDVPEAPPAGLAEPDDVEEDKDSTYVFDAFKDEETSTLTYSYTVV